MVQEQPLLDIRNLHVTFKLGRRELRAVDGVSLQLFRGESLGLVGESGCGKTTLGNAIVRMAPVSGGSISFGGRDIAAFRGDELRGYRRQVQMVFQDPYGSLNPRMTVGAAILEVLGIYRLGGDRAARFNRLGELMTAVGLEPGYSRRYPHEFSGGQRQRIGIARALAVSPSLVIADEPVSALDVSVQVQILNLLKDLQAKFSLSYLFVAHDLSVVRYMCQRVLVMYLGRVMESGPVDAVYSHPGHPYTEALLSAVPDVELGLDARKTGGRRRILLTGDVPSATRVIPGCRFHPRCPRAKDVCRKIEPTTVAVGDGHWSACHFASEVLARPAAQAHGA